MKPWKKKQNLIFVFIFFTFLVNSKCDDCSINCVFNGNSCETRSPTYTYSCGSYCKPKYAGSNDATTCYNCNGITGYYSITPTGNCINDCIGDKIIYDTGECTFQILNSVSHLGDIYYFTIPSTISGKITCADNVCTCINYYYVESVYGKKQYTCFNNINDYSGAGYKYYNFNTKEFFKDGCPSEFNIKKTLSGSITRCSDTCYEDEFLVLIPETSPSEIINEYCVDDCNQSPDSSYKLKYLINGIKRCLKNCPDGTYEKGNECVTLDECTYYKGDKCYDSCTSAGGPTGFQYHNKGSKECIAVCTGDYIYQAEIGGEKTCFRKEDCNFVERTGSSNNCLTSCSSPRQYHNCDDNECLASCDGGSNTKKYHADNDYICYESCSDIPAGDYIYEGFTDYTCYKEGSSFTGCDYYYKKLDNVRKCITINNCIDTLNKKYLVGKECTDSCDGYYQVEVVLSNTPFKTYIKCFETLNEALNDGVGVKYCDISQKKCWTGDNLGGVYYINSEFTILGKYEVVRECPNYYGEKSTPAGFSWCVDSCSEIDNKFFLSGYKKCLNSCSEVSKYYYDDSNKECLESCELRPTKPFSFPVSVGDPKCHAYLQNGKYHNYNSHTMLDNCGEDNSNNLYHKLSSPTDISDRVCYPSCLDIPDGNFKYETIDNICYETMTLPSSDCPYHYVKSNGIIKCATQQNCLDLKLEYLLGTECKRNVMIIIIK